MNVIRINMATALTMLALLALHTVRAEHILYDSAAHGLGGWTVEDDGVMGGLSQGRFSTNDAGHGVFSGEVSLANNGGFSSVQYYFESIDVSSFTTACLRIKGDGKDYRFLVEAEKNARHYYEVEFPTSAAWTVIELPLSSMVPVRRGDRLDLPNFPGNTLAQIRLMIANGAAESFRLEIDRIWLK